MATSFGERGQAARQRLLTAAIDELRLDLTMAFTGWFGEELPDRLPPRLAALQKRLLFGSDFPNLPYEYAHQVGSLARLDPGDEWMRDVRWRNGAALFGKQ